MFTLSSPYKIKSEMTQHIVHRNWPWMIISMLFKTHKSSYRADGDLSLEGRMRNMWTVTLYRQQDSVLFGL
ncbi:hypothetical protein LDENG_00220910 [Lucifuga dentata]|nr:hypothetical protein LDENG_00220910 [Lucifuga dentata]